MLHAYAGIAAGVRDSRRPLFTNFPLPLCGLLFNRNPDLRRHVILQPESLEQTSDQTPSI